MAIGRAIVREPGVLLFDEPLSNLDAQLRHDMRVELAELHRRIGATTVFVTHDQVEAMTLADRILILNRGRIEQFDTPKAIYHHPASVFVAKFIGAPPMNIMPVTGDGAVLRLADGQVVAQARLTGAYQLGIRPEDILIGGTANGHVLTAALRFRRGSRLARDPGSRAWRLGRQDRHALRCRNTGSQPTLSQFPCLPPASFRCGERQGHARRIRRKLEHFRFFSETRKCSISLF
ncbi:ABC-type Fe3+/spermidine/putrescine transport system ATPase subunit [Rhizobium brockwellii]